MDQVAIQDQWPDYVSHCWGCGRNNEHGLQIKSYWSGDEIVCTWQPKNYHMAAPGILCGGIIAALIDCHCLNAATAYGNRSADRGAGATLDTHYASASLKTTFLRPTPVNEPVILRARIKEMEEKRIVVSCSVISKGEECARGELIAVRVASEFWVK